MTADSVDLGVLKRWLALLGGEGWQGREARDRAVAEMRAVGAERLLPSLTALLREPAVEVRCSASEAILWLDQQQGMDLVLPLLDDPNATVRWNTCGLLHDFGDERAVTPLIKRMREDPAPDVRGTAAYALGGIGNTSAIPALQDTLQSDHQCDALGHSPSSAAAAALDEIFGTTETSKPV
jgi:HEAT repeat protein